MVKTVFWTLSLFIIAATVLPLVRSDQWWIRVFDFPRTQIVVLGFVAVGLFFAGVRDYRTLEWLAIGLLGIVVVYQAARIFPYTRLARYEVLPADPADSSGTVSLLVANVYQYNRKSQALLELIRTYQPDIVVTVETDAWWHDQLKGLEQDYPHTVKKPLDNTYGMLMYSRLALIDPRVEFLVEPDIPSVHSGVRLESGVVVNLHCIHPRPPYPKEDDDTTERDAEILIVGKWVKKQPGPSIVAGDMNDVAWSDTNRLFQKISGLLDPRVGRGLFNTFSAKVPFFRFPVDHVFFSNHFRLISLKRLPYFGSDHFPILATLSYEKTAPLQQPEPEPTGEDHEEANKKVEKAIP